MSEETLDLVPVGDRIIVVRKDIGAGSVLHIPKGVESTKTTEGRIVAKGEACEMVEVGQQVYFSRYVGKVVERNGVEYMIMSEQDVICIVKEAA